MADAAGNSTAATYAAATCPHTGPTFALRFAVTTWMHNRRDTALESLAERMRARKASGHFDAKALLAAMDAEAAEDGDCQNIDGQPER